MCLAWALRLPICFSASSPAFCNNIHFLRCLWPFSRLHTHRHTDTCSNLQNLYPHLKKKLRERGSNIGKPSCKICCRWRAWKSDHLCSGSICGAAVQRLTELDARVLEPSAYNAFHGSAHNSTLPELSEHGTNCRRSKLQKVPVVKMTVQIKALCLLGSVFLSCILIANYIHPASQLQQTPVSTSGLEWHTFIGMCA